MEKKLIKPLERKFKKFSKQKKIEEKKRMRIKKEREREAHKTKLIKIFYEKEELKRKKYLDYKNKIKTQKLKEVVNSKELVIMNYDSQNRTCKEICKKFQVKKPTGKGRYDAGQGHCQICDVWIDHKGAHVKIGTPATENSVGWFCNCCNYRVRQNPRNRIIKKKLNERIKNIESIKKKDEGIDKNLSKEENVNSDKTFKIDIEKINKWITDALILIRSSSNGFLRSELKQLLSISENEFIELIPRLLRIEDIFQTEIDPEGLIVNSRFKSKTFEDNQHDDSDSKINYKNQLREVKKNQVEKQTIKENRDSFLENLIKRIKQFTKEIALYEEENWNVINLEHSSFKDTFIKEYGGIYLYEILYDYYFISVVLKHAPMNWAEYYGAGGKYGQDRFEFIFGPWSKIREYLTNSHTNEVYKIKNICEIIKNRLELKKTNSSSDTVKNICNKIIEEHKRYNREINRDLKIELIDEYLKNKSIKLICSKHPNISENQIRLHLRTSQRLPEKIKIMLEEGAIHNDPDCALSIALFVTDYYRWDGDIHIVSEMLELIKKLTIAFQENPEQNLSLQGIKINDDKKIIINVTPTKQDKRKKIQKKYDVKYQNEWKLGDRTQKQYWKLYRHNDLRVVEFLHKWEFEHKNRIPSKLAWGLIAEPDITLQKYKID